MEYCSGCGRDVSTQQEKKQRRLLSGHSIQDVLQTLKNFIVELQVSPEMLDGVDGGYICRSCVRLIERYNSVHGELSKNILQALPVIRGSVQSLLCIQSFSLFCASSRHTRAMSLV